ncbi:glutathione S-transferase [Endobacter medicaginis]|uniref:Glutathione S-transferase n=1 Tax=Endobacter medicaginis TaxID=1181271 RepID=A0A839UZ36_9PROT|nr:glutathione S-transferase family protein [Endobacter medicaginis]MBB3173584.1 glutathione S-transferase [Endobacter medicaginis]MCX5475782.1 glutathione S-transferase family protein [Endobacter medicaginis]NVN29005.1 glutathione S-transferase family protein [Endobacter medicaginis]
MTTDELVLYTNPQSRGRIVRWMLEEVGAPYRVEVLGWGAPMRREDFLAINPMGKVPTLVAGGQVITETPAICAWLADTYPQSRLAPPPGDPGRAAYYRWLFYAAGPVEAACTDRTLGVTVPPDKRAMCGYGSFEEMLDVLDDALSVTGADWLCGPSFSVADLYLASQLGFMIQFKVIPPCPVFTEFVARAQGRPAFQRAAALDDAAVEAG